MKTLADVFAVLWMLPVTFMWVLFFALPTLFFGKLLLRAARIIRNQFGVQSQDLNTETQRLRTILQEHLQQLSHPVMASARYFHTRGSTHIIAEFKAETVTWGHHVQAHSLHEAVSKLRGKLLSEGSKVPTSIKSYKYHLNEKQNSEAPWVRVFALDAA